MQAGSPKKGDSLSRKEVARLRAENLNSPNARAIQSRCSNERRRGARGCCWQGARATHLPFAPHPAPRIAPPHGRAHLRTNEQAQLTGLGATHGRARLRLLMRAKLMRVR